MEAEKIIQVRAQKIDENISKAELAELKNRYGSLIISEFRGQVFKLAEVAGPFHEAKKNPYLLRVKKTLDEQGICRNTILRIIHSPKKAKTGSKHNNSKNTACHA